MKSKHDAIKEFNRAFNRYWRAEWINAQERELCSNAEYEKLYHKLVEKWNKLIDLKVDLHKLNTEICDNFQPYDDEEWHSLAVTRQCNYFYKFPRRKDFLFMVNKRK